MWNQNESLQYFTTNTVLLRFAGMVPFGSDTEDVKNGTSSFKITNHLDPETFFTTKIHSTLDQSNLLTLIHVTKVLNMVLRPRRQDLFKLASILTL